MAQFTFLVSVSQPQLGARLINGVVACLVNASSASNAKTNAALACNAAFANEFPQTDDTEKEFFDAGSVLFPATYFDTAVAVSASAGVPASGNGSVAGDAYVIPEPAVAPVYVDHTKYTPV